MYRPEIPQGSLSQQSFSHLARLVKYIEPRTRTSHAFAIGNLSRDDTQYEPGHGAVALIFGLRIQGATDHAGRRDPSFCHAIAVADRQLDATALLETALAFHEKIQASGDARSAKSQWYHTYVRPGESREAMRSTLEAYVAEFDDLPEPGPSEQGPRWTIDGTVAPSRIVIVYAEEESFEAIAGCAARIAEVLVESDIRWTAISTGREQDVPGGVSIRFVPEQDAGTEADGVPVFRLEEVPYDSVEIAARLFGASAVRSSQMSELSMGWQQMYGKRAGEGEVQRSSSDGGPPVSAQVPSLRPPAAGSNVVVVEISEDGGEKVARRDSSAGAVAAGTKVDAGTTSVAQRTERASGKGARKKPGSQMGADTGLHRCRLLNSADSPG
jgi:hypothetical protein